VTALICAATKWEAAPLEAKLGARHRVLRTGMGRKSAESALRAAPLDIDLAISAGFAGALQPAMRSGDLVIDIQGADADAVTAARETAQALNIPFHFGRVVCTESVVDKADQKEELGRSKRACAVDMESDAIREWAAGKGVPSLVARVVLDECGEDIPPGMPEGEDPASLAKYALGNLAWLPKLASLGLRQRRAANRLADFLDAFLPKLNA
jgi:adenosylhomocysteine nucleosidase